MRHGKKFNHLGRKAGHRRALLSNLASSLIEHKRINTTLAKAKALRKYVEPLLTKSKEDSTNSRRVVFSYLQNKQAVTELFREVAPKIMDRPGGYIRIIKTGKRLGDNAETALIELVDFNELYVKESGAKKGRRRRGAGKKKAAEATTTEVVEEVATEEAPAVEDAKVVEETTEAPAADEAPKAEDAGTDEGTEEEKKD